MALSTMYYEAKRPLRQAKRHLVCGDRLPGSQTEGANQRQVSMPTLHSVPGLSRSCSRLLRVEGAVLGETSLEGPETNKAVKVFKALSLTQRSCSQICS